MTNDEMRKELEAAGCSIQLSDGSYKSHSIVVFPDNSAISYQIPFDKRFTPEREVAYVIDAAYAHLEQQRELAALRDYVKQIHHAGKLLPPTLNVSPDSPIGQIARVVWRSFAYLERFNITADESDET